MIFDLYGLLRLEARRSAGLLLFPFVVLAVWFLSDQGRARGIWLWPDVSLSIESTVVLVARRRAETSRLGPLLRSGSFSPTR